MTAEAPRRHGDDCYAVWWDAYTHRRGSKTATGSREGRSSPCGCWCHKAATA